MSIYIKVYLVFILSIIQTAVTAQQSELPDNITSLLEMISDDGIAQADIDSWSDMLQEISENPVRINQNNNPDLQKLFFLTSFQIKAIEDYRKRNGDIVSAPELAMITGFDRELVEIMLPFITFSASSPVKEKPKGISNSLLTSFVYKPNEGEEDFTEFGKLLARYKLSAGRFSTGFTAEKDAGERLISGNPPLPDFLSGNVCYTGKGVVQKIILGDFSVRFGAGTNINTSFRTSLPLSLQTFQPVRNEIRPYTSAEENRFFRGAAGSFRYGKASLSLFYSSLPVDGSIDPATGYITGFNTSGIHSDSVSFTEKDNIRKNSAGANLVFNLGSISAGMVYSATTFSSPLQPPSDTHNNSAGSSNYNISLYMSGVIHKIILSLEATTDKEGNVATIGSVVFKPSDRLSMNLIARSYPGKFTAFNGNGPGYSATNKNENGILAAFNFEAARHLFISGGADLLRFPGPRYYADFPSVAVREEIRIRYTPTENFSTEAMVGYRYTETNIATERGLTAKDESETLSARVLCRYSPLSGLVLTTRFDFKKYSTPQSIGYAIYQDLHYTFRKVPVDVWWRYSIFKTDGWDSRIYQYENDLLYSFSIPAFSGSGTRTYLMAGFKPAKNVSVRIKAATTLSRGVNGYSHTDELKAQIKLDF